MLETVLPLNGTKAKIVELGCGTADISGAFASRGASDGHDVRGVDCARAQIDIARIRWPKGDWLLGPVEYFAVQDCDVLILCEFLEHVENPRNLVEQWLPRAANVIISHPLDEPVGSHLSGDDHVWSFSEHDFDEWFRLGGHDVIEKRVFAMGAYTVAMGLGKRKNSNDGEKR